MSLKAYDAYLFDLDGTLVDTAPDIMVGLNVSLAEHGFAAVDEALTRHWVGHGARKLIEQAMLHHGRAQPAPDLIESMLQRFLDYYGAHVADDSTAYPGVAQTLDQLQERAALGVVTNKHSRLTLPLLDALDLSRYFGVIVSGDTLDNPKPAADPALHACAVLQADIARTLFVGDSATDVACARSAGCDIVCVRDGYSHGTRPEDLGADRVIDSLIALV